MSRQRENDDPAYLHDLRESAAIVAERLRNKRFPDFAADPALQDNVIRRLTIIGQAARHTTPRTRKIIILCHLLILQTYYLVMILAIPVWKI